MSAEPVLWDGDTIPGLVITHTPPRRRPGGAAIAADLEQARAAAARATLDTIGARRGPKPRPVQAPLLVVVPAPVHPLVEDIQWLLDCGETLDGIAFRLGKRPEAIVRALQPDRLDRPELLARLQTAADEVRLPVARRALPAIGAPINSRPALGAGTVASARLVAAGRAVEAPDAAGALRELLACLGLDEPPGGP